MRGEGRPENAKRYRTSVTKVETACRSTPLKNAPGELTRPIH